MVKKIVLITTGQPSTNPRIVKEADALAQAGHTVTLLFCFVIDWATQKDKVLLEGLRWNYKMVGGSPGEKKWLYFFTRTRNKLALILADLVPPRFLLAERAQARAYDELLAEAIKLDADWYIGHNLGALAVAVKAAGFCGSKAGFDFEDYHRGEVSPYEKSILQRISYLENKYVPLLSYFSTSSKMITEATKKNHRYFKGVTATLLNCFPLKQQPAYRSESNGNELQLFWFSQTIGVGRGLESLIKALIILGDVEIHLTLAGRCNEDMLNYINTAAVDILPNVHFAGIIQPEMLPAYASRFDVGLALETGFSENNDIALSNKIFTYLLAGNGIILTETSMQKEFNREYKIGESFSINDEYSLAEKIKHYKCREKLNKQRFYNYEIAKTLFNWEEESCKFLELIT